jgi:hypothetical protein
MRRTIPICVLLLSACDPETTPADRIGDCHPGDGRSDPFADCVQELVEIEGSDFGHEGLPEVVLGPPGGSLDVASLGCGGSITLYFEDPVIADGPGPDLIVFENPFSDEFPEPGQVSVSEDGETWHAFDCDPVALEGCAGLTPVTTDDGSVDYTDPARAGGDAFDLADLGVERARYVRIDDVSADYWADAGDDYCDPGQAGKGGFDLDAVAAINVAD